VVVIAGGKRVETREDACTSTRLGELQAWIESVATGVLRAIPLGVSST
jgi:hypothetical protein